MQDLTLSELIANWEKAADATADAINTRDNNKFDKSSAEGRECFNHIRTLIQFSPPGTADPFKEDLKRISARWTGLLDSIKAWMQDVKCEIHDTEEKIQSEKKLSNAYHYMKQTGINLKVKAN